MSMALQIATGTARQAPAWRGALGTLNITRHHLNIRLSTHRVLPARGICTATSASRFGSIDILRRASFSGRRHWSLFPESSFSPKRSISTLSTGRFRNDHQRSTTISQFTRHASSQPVPHVSSSSPTPKPTTTTPTTSIPTPPTTLRAKPLSPSTVHENIYTLPNILTFTRLLAAPGVGYLLLTHQPLPALLLFTYAGITDLVDGYLARRFNQQTVVGTVIDPMADKLLMTITVLSLGITHIFPWWLVTIILGRDIALAISAIWWRWISLPPPKTMMRYWDFSLPSAEVRPTEISKINTMLQLLLVGNALVLPVLPAGMVEMGNLGGVLEGWEYLVAATTVWSGASYVGNKDAVKIIGQEEGKGRAGGGEMEIGKGKGEGVSAGQER